MNIAVDFDGTCVKHMYPKVGEDVPNCERVLKRLVNEGHNLILFTMRSDGTLNDAVKWFKEKNIPLYGIQENPTQKNWTNSPKAYADIYIDDSSLGALITGEIENGQLKGRFYIDWNMVEEFMTKLGYLK